MKVCLLKYKGSSANPINSVMENSLIDLGHELVDHVDAEIVIGIRDLFRVEQKCKDKKYILFQIEQYIGKPSQIDFYYAFGPDEIWGFDIENEKEIYTPLGYHPCLLFKSLLLEDIDIGFFGYQKERHEIWRSKARNIWININTFNDKLHGENISRTKINLNIHFHDGSKFTEWGRICYFLANEQFFISERLYCPIDVPQFETIKEYDSLIDFYLERPDERKEIARVMSREYREKFDMRDILRKRGF